MNLLDELAVLRISGTDATSFLHNQLTNDIHAVDATHAQLSGWCSPKGRLLALFRVCRSGNDYLLILPRTLCEAIIARLRLYIVISQVTLVEAADVVVAGVIGLDNTSAAADTVFERNGALLWRVRDTAVPRWLVVGTTAAVAAACAAGQQQTMADWRRLDIAAGLPQVYPATSDAFIPQQLWLETLNGLSFSKGCFPGQEVVARLHYKGTVKQRSHYWRMTHGGTIAAGDTLIDSDGHNSGTVVDAVLQGGEWHVLGVVREGVETAALRIQ